MRAHDTALQVYSEFAHDQARAAILAANTYQPTIFPAVEPNAPISPKPLQNTLVGGVLGFLVGISAAFASEYMTGKAGHGQSAASDAGSG